MLSDMTANQYVAAIERLGINKSQAAVLLGLDLRTQRRYLSGERTVPEPIARFLTYLVETRETGAFRKLLARHVKTPIK